MTFRPVIPIVIGILAVAALVGGFVAIGTPAHQRRIALDEVTISDLLIIADTQRRAAGEPVSAKPPPVASDGRTVDPASYAYRRLTARTFELCAVFLEPSAPDSPDRALRHTAGRTCFRFDARNPTRPL
jgi:hypothetical protein